MALQPCSPPLPCPHAPAGALPEALRPRPGQLTPQQQRVYEDFARIPRTAAAAAQSAGQPRPAGSLGSEGGEPGAPGMPGGPDAEAAAAAQAAAGAAGMAPPGTDLRSRFISWLQRMDLAISKDRQAQLSQLSDGSGGWGEGAAVELAALLGRSYQHTEGGAVRACVRA